VIDRSLIETALDMELGKIRKAVGADRFAAGTYAEAAGILRDLVLADEFVEFLTLPAYERVTTFR
jgi:malate synthase